MTEQSPSDTQRFIGLILIVASLLWMGLSGLCAAWLIGGMLVDGASSTDFWGWGLMIFIMSGLSIGAAYAVFVVGRGLRR